ncbi:MAG TPA: hypothetical protein VMF58_07810, partial [Rhizomicrobium sp.]|nr:hypothetical protein [Rhizomicrobium sp.]
KALFAHHAMHCREQKRQFSQSEFTGHKHGVLGIEYRQRQCLSKMWPRTTLPLIAIYGKVFRGEKYRDLAIGQCVVFSFAVSAPQYSSIWF